MTDDQATSITIALLCVVGMIAIVLLWLDGNHTLQDATQNTLYSLGDQKFVGKEIKNYQRITFDKDYDLTAWMCTNTAEVTDAEDIAFNNNTIEVIGNGYCGFKLEKK